jgi:23S rRNA (adenine2503-C2)-methyltransferase
MDIKSFTKAELETRLLEHGEKSFRARQILKWVYQKGAVTFAEMTDLSASLRALLDQEFSIARLSCAHVAPAGVRVSIFSRWQTNGASSLIPAEDHSIVYLFSGGLCDGLLLCNRTSRPLRD